LNGFEWDEAKRAINLVKHKVDLLAGTVLFDGRPVATIPSRFIGEERYATTGRILGDLYTLIWTKRSNDIRLISLRRARDGERRAYLASYPS
jgi:uncharacterized DUF497 family protein